MFPDMLKKVTGKVLRTVNRNLDRAEEQMEKWLGQTGLVSDTTLSTLSEMSTAYRNLWESALLNPLRFVEAESQLLRQHVALGVYGAARACGQQPDPVATAEPDDRRFAAEEWRRWLPYDYLHQAYLLNAQALLDWVEQMPGIPGANHDQMRFYVRQVVSALSPSNFLASNPEALRITVEQRGQNLLEGGRQLLTDISRNPGLFNVAMADVSAFRIGENIATTPGQVVYQNELMQLIQYSPSTPSVYQRPLLVVPPWINKFYILDLTPQNSLIRWMVEQGLTVFVISWVNPGPELRDKGFEDYMLEGPLQAMQVIQAITGEEQLNALGYCIGGTLLGSTLAWLAKKGRQPVASATYLTTLLDFSDPGGIGVFINEHSLSGIERMLQRQGYLDGRAMAFTFNLLRENELFWSFWINNYLKGKPPAAFDLLYWNTDGTNLPARMHAYYLRQMYLENRLVQADALTLAGESIDLAQIEVPSFFLSTQQDHIAKWKTTYRGARVHGGERTFVLAGSGHIAGVVNPPAKGKYGYWCNAQLPEDAEQWLAGAERHPGSWWPHWLQWLTQYAGEQVPPREPGSADYPPLQAAPGSYVRVRAADAIAAGQRRAKRPA